MNDPLLERVQQGDRAALELLLSRYAPSIYRFALRMCKNPADAQDTLQDTLLSMATHIGQFAGRSSLSSWVFALARSACSRRRRGKKNQPMLGEDAATEGADLAPTPEDAAAQRELVEILTEALDRLPDAYREVLLLRDVEGLTAPEAADALGLSIEALKSRLHRARSALRGALRPALEATEAPRGASCPDVVSAWSHKLEGDLSSADCASMERHIETCPACGPACEALRRSLSACQRVGQAPVPDAIQAQVREAVRRFAQGPALR